MTGTVRTASPSLRTRTYLVSEFIIGMIGTANLPLGLSASEILLSLSSNVSRI